ALGVHVELVKGDLLAPASLDAAVRGVDAIAHCAAFFRGATPEQALAVNDELDLVVLRLPFVYGDGDPHIAEAVPMMRGFPATQRMSIAHHADVARAVERVLDAPTLAHRVYNVVDDEAPDLATIFASVGAPPPDGSGAEAARAFD